MREGVGAGGPNLWPGISILIVPAVGDIGAERVCSTDRADEGVDLTKRWSPHRSDHHWDWNCERVEKKIG